jgi:hypothetical protein
MKTNSNDPNTKSNAKKQLPAKKTGKIGMGIIQTLVNQLGWSLHPTGDDEVGVDGFIELFRNAESVNAFIGMQSKCTKTFDGNSINAFVGKIKTRDVAYWQNLNLPLIVIFTNPSQHDAYYILASKIRRSDSNITEISGSQLQKLTSSSLDELLEAAQSLAEIASTVPDLADKLSSLLSGLDPDFNISVSIKDGKKEFTFERKEGSSAPYGFRISPSVSAEYQHFKETGKPLELKPGEVSPVLPPSITKLFNFQSLQGVLLTSRINADASFPIRLEMTEKNGVTSSIDLTLKPKHVGEIEATFVAGEDSPTTITITTRLDTLVQNFELKHHTKGSVKKNLAHLNFLNSLSNGGVLRVIQDENDVEMSRSEIPSGVFPKPEAAFVAMIDKLMTIQRLLPAVIEIPSSGISSLEVDKIFRLHEIVTSGVEEVQEVRFSNTVSAEDIRTMLSRVPTDKHLKFGMHTNNNRVLLLGTDIDLGETYVLIEKADFEGGRASIESLLSYNPEEIDITMFQIENTSGKQYYLKYYKGKELKGVLK